MSAPFKLTGLVAAAHTPFNSKGLLYPEAVEMQARHLASQNIDKVFITGSTGESSSLQLEERKELLHAWKESGQKHGMHVIAHVGGNCIKDGVELASLAHELELAAIAALAPSYYRPGSVTDLVQCCAEMADAAPTLPFYYYDIPVLTQVRFSMIDFMKAASVSIPNFAGVKFTNPDLAHYLEALSWNEGDIDLPWGVDEWLLGALATGAKGAVGSTYNFAPALYHRLICAFENNDMETARECQRLSVEMISLVASRGYMGCAKAIMNWLDIPVGPARLPLRTPSTGELKDLRRDLKNIGFFHWACQ